MRITELKADIPPSQRAKGTTGGRGAGEDARVPGSERLAMATLYGAWWGPAGRSGAGRTAISVDPFTSVQEWGPPLP